MCWAYCRGGLNTCTLKWLPYSKICNYFCFQPFWDIKTYSVAKLYMPSVGNSFKTCNSYVNMLTALRHIKVPQERFLFSQKVGIKILYKCLKTFLCSLCPTTTLQESSFHQTLTAYSCIFNNKKWNIYSWTTLTIRLLFDHNKNEFNADLISTTRPPQDICVSSPTGSKWHCIGVQH